MLKKTEEFKNNLLNIINNSTIGIDLIYYIFTVVYNELEKEYYKQLNRELKNEEIEFSFGDQSVIQENGKEDIKE